MNVLLRSRMSQRYRQFLLGIALVSMLLCTGVIATPYASSQDMIPRTLLVDMARNQFSVMCQSEAFASCMGFTTQVCLELSESAITQCLMPLPSEISLETLDNSALETCPVGVYAEAGFSEEKAGMCFDKAMEAG